MPRGILNPIFACAAQEVGAAVPNPLCCTPDTTSTTRIGGYMAIENAVGDQWRLFVDTMGNLKTQKYSEGAWLTRSRVT